MNKYVLLFFLAALNFIYPPLSSKGNEVKNTDIKQTMKKNFDALINLQIFAADPKSFSDPSNKNEIQKNLDSMSGIEHALPQKMADQEPGLAAISSLFSEYLIDIQKSFKSGSHSSFTRNQVRTMTAFCLSCHTRVSTNQTFMDLQNKIDSTTLTDFQKAEFYAATRQFDKAITLFDKIISKTPTEEFGYIELGRAVREVLNITIRVKQDPKVTFSILEKLSNRKDVPEFFQRYVEQWKIDVKKWMLEKRNPKSMKPSELMSKSKSLIEQAAKRQLFPVDPSGDVNYLRATNYIHEAMQKEPHGSFRGEALYFLGTCYDSLQDPTLWALDSLYFEACIREFSHSEISKKCYKRYASKLYFSYSGSGGTFVPEDEIKKLTELRKLSQ